MKTNDSEAQSEAPSVDEVLDWELDYMTPCPICGHDHYDTMPEDNESLWVFKAKINRLIVQGRLERGIYELERLEHDPQMFGDWEKVVEERIHLLETELSALSNNLSKEQ